MIGLPQSTEFNKRIPKQKFYENLTVSASLKQSFVDQIKTIYWRNKIAASTVNIAEGTDVEEIEVFEIKLTGENIDEGILKQMDKEIPYHILFLLEHEGKYQAWIGYKEEAQSGTSAFKVNSYYHTDWLQVDDLPVKMEGLSIDAVYENFVRQIAGDSLKATNQESLKDSVDRDNRRQDLQKQIDKLQQKVRKEKQLNKQMQMNTELKALKRELDELT
ncbi:MAG: DUF4391 domain-containing protein [Butyrivibrio sp.]|nr:DUF4391 domain-containing protein [Butyrivibrio sp.]